MPLDTLIALDSGLLLVLGLVASFVLLLGASHASASEELAIPFTPSAEEIREAEEAPSHLTDAEAAEHLPHSDLDRYESEELLQGVFGQLIAAPSELFAGLSIENLISPHAGIVAEDGEGSGVGGSQSFLLQSTIPLGTENTEGSLEPLDLDIASNLNGLRPENPLVDVALPAELGDGVTLPASEIQLTLEGAPQDRKPSILGSSVAFYPNVEEDTDFAVTPTATGFETFTQLRSPDAPRVQTFQMTLPSGAQASEAANGGAEVVSSQGDLLATVLPPSAVDASGDAVPVSLSVDGDALVVAVSPEETSRFPIIVDPTVEDVNHWETSSARPGWGSYTTPVSSIWNTYTTPAWTCDTYCHLQVAANPNGWTNTNAQSYWNYTVPRWKEDYEATGARPTSYVATFTVGNMGFSGNGDYQTSPQALFAVSNEKGEWQTANMYPPNISGSYGVDLKANQTGRMASFGMFATGNSYLNSGRYINVGWAQVLLGDALSPSWGSISSPTQWVNKQAAPFNMTVSDAGLGVANIKVKNAGGTVIGTTYVQSGTSNCVGNNSLPCSRTWKGAQEGHLVNYDPTNLPQGINNLPIVASDPVGNQATQTLQVRVDHTAPELSLSGTLTEQATLGATLPQYTLKISAKDGTSVSPQSGAATAELKIDNVKVKEWNPGCGSENCTIATEWTAKASELSFGKHKAEVIATDAAGIESTVKSVEFEIKKDETPPALSPTATFYSAPEGWLEQKTYDYNTTASDAKGSGVATMTLKIDGSVVKTTSQSCPAGGCSKSFGSSSLNMANYKGGEHPAELLATDGAGNVAKFVWTINVDPSGAVASSEIANTLEASDGTSGSTVVAPNEEVIPDGERDQGNDPLVVQQGSDLSSSGVPVSVEYTTDLSKGIVVNGAEGSVKIAPDFPTGGAQSTSVVDGSVSVTSNTAPQSDTIIRPVYDGLMAFQSIRGSSAPETYEWDVELNSGQYLTQLNEQEVGVYYADGTLALAIAAEPAHDAVGTSVPTTLTKSGTNQITLSVKHGSGGFIYPVIAGPGFRASYETSVITQPTIESPATAKEVEEVSEDANSGLVIGAPESSESDPWGGSGGASASGVSYARNAKGHLCSAAGCSWWDRYIKFHFHFNYKYAWWKDNQVHPNCTEAHSTTQVSQDLEYCDWIGPNHQPYGAGYHISTQLAVAVTATFPVLGVSHQSNITFALFTSTVMDMCQKCITPGASVIPCRRADL